MQEKFCFLQDLNFRRINKNQGKRFGSQHQNQESDGCIDNHHQRAGFNPRPNTFRLSGTVILTAKGSHSHTQTLQRTKEKHFDTHRRSKSCHTRRTQRIIRTLKHDTANGRNGELQSHRNANGKQRLRQLRLILPFFRRAPQNVKLPIHINVTKKSGNSLRKDSSNGSSHHSPAQYQNTE